MIHKRNISIIIPNYNGEHLLKQYLPSTYAAIKNTKVLFEVIIVDDASTDQSSNFIKTHYPEIILIANSQNKGFSHACNTGINAAKYELILLLNSDVKLAPDYFDYQWKYFEHEDTFGVMGRIIDMEGDHIQVAASALSFNGFKMKYRPFFYSDNDDLVPTSFLCGANALIDAKKLKEIGGFNEILSPFYSEDFELGLRAWRLNWKCWYEHQAICRHELSASTKKYKSPRWVKAVYFRNRFFVHAIHLSGFRLLGWYFQIILIDLIPQVLTGKFWLIKSYLQLFHRQSAIKLSRKKLSHLMQKSNSDKSITQVAEELNSMIRPLQIRQLK